MMKKGRIKTSKKAEGIESNKWTYLIEDALGKESQVGRDRFFASSAALCARQTAGLVMIPNSLKSHMDASSQFYFGIGNEFENIMAKAFDKADIIVDRETRVESSWREMPVSGRVDFVIKDPENDELVLVELKSCGKLPHKPKPAHLAQLMTYLTLTGMKRGLIWYVSRSVADYKGVLKQKVFEITPTTEEKANTIRTIATGIMYAASDFLPPIPLDMKKYKCGFCPLVPFCWEEESGPFEGVSLLEPSLKFQVKTGKIVESLVVTIISEQDKLRKGFVEAVDVW